MRCEISYLHCAEVRYSRPLTTHASQIIVGRLVLSSLRCRYVRRSRVASLLSFLEEEAIANRRNHEGLASGLAVDETAALAG